MDAMSQYELHNENLRATVDTLGATLISLAVLIDGSWRDITIGAGQDVYAGRTVGRYANRLEGGRFSLDGTTFQTSANEPPNSLHGGDGGFSNREWTLVAATASTVAMRLTSADGDQGYPGQLEVAAVFDLGPHTLTITYAATTDKPTIVNLTLHPYFNLGTTGVNDELVLWLNADSYLPTRDDGIPTGDIDPVLGTGLDFTSPRSIAEARAEMLEAGLDRRGALDHCFIVPGDGVREMVHLTGDGITLSVLSDADCVQIYDGTWFDGTAVMPDGRVVCSHAGLAIEPEDMVDAPNHPSWPSSILRPGETWSRTITIGVSA